MAGPASYRWGAVAGVVVSAIFVWLALRHLDLHAIADVLRRAVLFPWIPLAALSYLVGHAVRGQRLRVLVRREANLRLPTASNVVVVGYASNNVLPARLGEFVRAGMLAERTGMPLAQTLTVTLIERLLDGVAILLLLVVCSRASHPAGWVADLARVGALVFGVAIAALAFATWQPRLIVRVASRVARPLGRAWHERALSLSTSIVNATACLRSPRDALVLGTLSVVVWCCEAMMFVALLPALGLPASFSMGAIAMAVTNLGILVPSTPGFIGPFHYFCSQALIASGVAEATALGFATVVHLTFFVPVTLWGAGAMLWYGVQLGETAARVRAARNSPKTKVVAGVTVHVIAPTERRPEGAAASAFDRALTEAVLPDELASRPALVDEVATFFARSMAALPSGVRSLYQLGMFGFRVYVRVRFLRSFCGLPNARRRRAVESWAFGPLVHLRQLFRPVRSTVLLAGYEHDARADGTRRDGAHHLPIAEPEGG